MKKIETVLFDLDGVLVDACDWHYDALNMSLIDCGYNPISREDHISTYNGLPTKIKLKMLNVSDLHISHICERKQKYTIETISKTATLCHEQINLHKHLKSLDIKIACVTNSIRETAELMLTKTGQYEYIDLLVTNEDVQKNKPYPDCYNYAINNLKSDPLTAVCVEDSEKGIQAAISSTAAHVWVVSGVSDVNVKNYNLFLEN